MDPSSVTDGRSEFIYKIVIHMGPSKTTSLSLSLSIHV
jgi:hypothetical protein